MSKAHRRTEVEVALPLQAFETSEASWTTVSGLRAFVAQLGALDMPDDLDVQITRKAITATRYIPLPLDEPTPPVTAEHETRG